MVGKYRLNVSNKRIKYDITINRNITIIQGDSATGKTTLVKLISDYNEEGKASGVKLSCDKNCEVLKGKDWEYKLSQINDSIIFIDEGSKFVTSNDFARAIQNSDNYFVIITREDLHSLPYSVSEIYGLKQVGNTKIGEQVYNLSYRIYAEYKSNRIVIPNKVITEDSNAGFTFFSEICKQLNIECIHANGKSNINKFIVPKELGDTLIIADGAAFGDEIRRVINKLKEQPGYVLYLPESFEWLLLKSNIFNSQKVKDILSNPEKYIDSKEFISWERFFTWLVEDTTSNLEYVKKYSKTNTKLDKFYYKENIKNKILDAMENIKLNT